MVLVGWIEISIGNANSVRIQQGKNEIQKKNKMKKFQVLQCWIRICYLPVFLQIRMLPTTSQKKKKNLDFYRFCDFFMNFHDANVPSSNKHK
jgi:hypothetical protein